MTAPGFTLWLTGLPGAGKTTLAARLRDVKADRDENVRRIGLVARLLAAHGVVAIVAAVSPYRDLRDEVRRAHAGAFVEVFVDCGLTELIRRDPKGLYARAIRGEIQEFSGISAPYEAPAAPDIHVRTDTQDVEDTVRALVSALDARGLLA
jgi:adenylyl-sulfate kinase